MARKTDCRRMVQQQRNDQQREWNCAHNCNLGSDALFRLDDASGARKKLFYELSACAAGSALWRGRHTAASAPAAAPPLLAGVVVAFEPQSLAVRARSSGTRVIDDRSKAPRPVTRLGLLNGRQEWTLN